MSQRILIIAPSWVGDAVMMQVLMSRLLEQDPQHHITVMAPAWSLGLMERLPGVAATLVNPFAHGALALAERRRLGLSLRGQFDRVFVLPNSFKSALLPWFANIPERVGYVGECRWGLLNDARRLDKVRLPRMVDRFVALAETGLDFAPPAAPRLRSTAAEQHATLSALNLDKNRPVLALCPGAEYGPAKRWPVSHFAELARYADQQGWQVWLLGSAKDQSISQAIQASAPMALDLCGKTTLAQVVDLLASASWAVCNDSGLMHITAAVDTPQVALYGSSSPGFTPPLSPFAVVTSLKLNCSPCFKRECPLGHTHCLTELLPTRVQSIIWPE